MATTRMCNLIEEQWISPRIRPKPNTVGVKAIFRHILQIAGYVLFALMLVIPSQLQIIKLFLMVFLIIALVANSIVRGAWSIHPVIANWTMFLVALGCAFVLLGWYREAPGALRVATVYIFWPIVFTIFVSGIGKNIQFIYGLLRIMVYATIVIALIVLGIIKISAFGLITEVISHIDQDFDPYLFKRYPVSSLVFLIPFLIVAALFGTAHWSRVIKRIWIWIALAFALMASVMADRRALWAVIVIGLMIGVQLTYGMSTRAKLSLSRLFMRIGILLFITMLGVVLLLMINYDYVINSLILSLDNLDLSSIRGDSIRSEQLYALLTGWLQQPLFGTGLGAIIPGVIRDPDMPWAAELTYPLLLYHTGIMGFLSYSAGVVWIFWMGIRVSLSKREPNIFMNAILAGLLCFLIANTTNPYLVKYDYMWVLFLPIAFINYWLLTNPRPRTKDLLFARFRANKGRFYSKWEL